MSTVLISVNPGQTLDSLTIAPGPGITTGYVELQIDLGNRVNDSNAGASPRPVKKSEVLSAIDYIVQAIHRDTTYIVG
jgi:hypothetical protein